jgi:hypothetical protein
MGSPARPHPEVFDGGFAKTSLLTGRNSRKKKDTTFLIFLAFLEFAGIEHEKMFRMHQLATAQS